jgi:hypothetical protein
MRPNRLEKIKQAQMAEAKEKGISYQELVGNKQPTPNRLERIKNGDKEAGNDNQAPGNDDQGHKMFHQLKAGLEVDLQRISNQSKMDDKIALKREVLPNYLPFVQDYMAQGHDYPNMVAVQVLIWLLDVGEMEEALELGFYLTRTPKQDLPPKFTRDIPTFICDAVYDWANAELDAGRSASPYLDQVVAVMLDDNWQLAMPVASKMPNMLAKHELAKGNLANAVHWCDLAARVNPKGHGTKGLRDKAVKQLKAKAEAQAEGEK